MLVRWYFSCALVTNFDLMIVVVSTGCWLVFVWMSLWDMELLHLVDSIGDCQACLWYLMYLWMGFILYHQLRGPPLKVADVGVFMVKFDGFRVSAVNGWNSSQPSLTSDGDGVVIVDFWSIVEAIVAS